MLLGIAFLLFVSKNPEWRARAGLDQRQSRPDVCQPTTWPAYLGLLAQMTAMAASLFLFASSSPGYSGASFPTTP